MSVTQMKVNSSMGRNLTHTSFDATDSCIAFSFVITCISFCAQFLFLYIRLFFGYVYGANKQCLYSKDISVFCFVFFTIDDSFSNFKVDPVTQPKQELFKLLYSCWCTCRHNSKMFTILFLDAWLNSYKCVWVWWSHFFWLYLYTCCGFNDFWTRLLSKCCVIGHFFLLIDAENNGVQSKCKTQLRDTAYTVHVFDYNSIISVSLVAVMMNSKNNIWPAEKFAVFCSGVLLPMVLTSTHWCLAHEVPIYIHGKGSWLSICDFLELALC